MIMETTTKISIHNMVASPYQGRFIIDGAVKNHYAIRRLKELSNSIITNGLLHPVMVRKKNRKYEIIDGHRRVAAFKKLGMDEIPAIIVDKSDKDAQVMSVISNLQRTSLSNLEKALAFEKILKSGIFKSKKELSRKIGKDETYVGDIMNILKMDKRIIDDLAKNQTTNDVRLLRLIRNTGSLNEKGESEQQYRIYRQFIDKKLSREELEELINQTRTGTDKVFKVSYGIRGFSVKVHQKLTNQQKDLLKKVLEQKVAEALKEITK